MAPRESTAAERRWSSRSTGTLLGFDGRNHRVCVRKLRLQNRFSAAATLHRVVVKILQLTWFFRHRERSATGYEKPIGGTS
jgi:hypothetical protein